MNETYVNGVGVWLTGRISLCEALDSMSRSVKQTHQKQNPETEPQKEPETIPAVFVGSLSRARWVWFDSSLCLLTLCIGCSHPEANIWDVSDTDCERVPTSQGGHEEKRALCGLHLLLSAKVGLPSWLVLLRTGSCYIPKAPGIWSRLKKVLRTVLRSGSGRGSASHIALRYPSCLAVLFVDLAAQSRLPLLSASCRQKL